MCECHNCPPNMQGLSSAIYIRQSVGPADALSAAPRRKPKAQHVAVKRRIQRYHLDVQPICCAHPMMFQKACYAGASEFRSNPTYSKAFNMESWAHAKRLSDYRNSLPQYNAPTDTRSITVAPEPPGRAGFAQAAQSQPIVEREEKCATEQEDEDDRQPDIAPEPLESPKPPEPPEPPESPEPPEPPESPEPRDIAGFAQTAQPMPLVEPEEECVTSEQEADDARQLDVAPEPPDSGNSMQAAQPIPLAEPEEECVTSEQEVEAEPVREPSELELRVMDIDIENETSACMPEMEEVVHEEDGIGCDLGEAPDMYAVDMPRSTNRGYLEPDREIPKALYQREPMLEPDCESDEAVDGLLHYKKWWYFREVDIAVKGKLLTGTPIFVKKHTLRVVNDLNSYFIPMKNIDFIRTPDGLEAACLEFEESFFD